MQHYQDRTCGLEKLKAHIKAHPPNLGDGESVLTVLYECCNENDPYDNERSGFVEGIKIGIRFRTELGE